RAGPAAHQPDQRAAAAAADRLRVPARDQAARGRALLGMRVTSVLIAGCLLLWSPGFARAAEDNADGRSSAGWTVEYNLRVPMSDGVELSTDVYRPSGDRPVAAILERNP